MALMPAQELKRHGQTRQRIHGTRRGKLLVSALPKRIHGGSLPLCGCHAGPETAWADTRPVCAGAFPSQKWGRNVPVHAGRSVWVAPLEADFWVSLSAWTQTDRPGPFGSARWSCPNTLVPS